MRQRKGFEILRRLNFQICRSPFAQDCVPWVGAAVLAHRAQTCNHHNNLQFSHMHLYENDPDSIA